jgi:hypothetical protein
MVLTVSNNINNINRTLKLIFYILQDLFCVLLLVGLNLDHCLHCLLWVLWVDHVTVFINIAQCYNSQSPVNSLQTGCNPCC